MKYSIRKLLSELDIPFKILGPQDPQFSSLRPAKESDKDSLVFIDKDRKDKAEIAISTVANVVLVDEDFIPPSNSRKSFVIVSDPRFVIVQIGRRYFLKPRSPSIHPTAVISPEAEIHPTATIGPFCTIGRCKIGAASVIEGHCYLYDGVIVGNNVEIGPGCVIGKKGFGYIRDPSGNWVNFPHLGGVIIEDDVEIGSNTCIDKGSLGNTIIGCGAKIDNLVHVAHNVRIGKRSLIIADAMLGGSCTIGDDVWVAPSSSIRNQLKIGSNSLIGLGAVVTKNVPDGETWMGVPARKID